MVVRPLREHPEFVLQFAHQFEKEWPGWYGPGGEAGAMVCDVVYCATATATSLLHRLDWHLLEQTSHDGKPIFLFASSRAA